MCLGACMYVCVCVCDVPMYVCNVCMCVHVSLCACITK